ncbi:MAG: PAS domain S-box protein [Asgard group archaeon]|nr:PAS domain S-box protein [Asgard group archaeon]
MNKLSKAKKIDTQIKKYYQQIAALFSKLDDSFFSSNVRYSFITSQGELIYTSGNSEKIIGYKHADFEVLSTFGYVHPDDRKKIRDEFLKFNDDSFSNIMTYRIFKPSGEMRWIKGLAHKFTKPKTEEQIGSVLIEYDASKEVQKESNELFSRNFYKILFDSIFYPKLVIRNQQIIWVSDNWETFFGIRKEKLNDPSLKFLFADKHEFSEFLTKYPTDVRKKGHTAYKCKLIGKGQKIFDGEIRVFAFDASDLSKGLLFIFENITKKRTKRQSIKEKLTIYESITNNCDLPIIYLENDKIIWYNPAVNNIFLYNREELLKRNIQSLLKYPEKYGQFKKNIINNFVKKQNYHYPLTFLSKNQDEKEFLVHVVPFSYENTEKYVLILESKKLLENYD